MAQGMIGPKFYGYDADGVPLAGGKLYTYEAGTTTPKATYTDEGQATPNANPIILNSEGYADVYLDGSYNMVLKDSLDVEMWSSDPVSSQLDLTDLPDATELVKGVAQIVTTAEMAAKVNDTKFVTAKKVWAILGSAATYAIGVVNGTLVLKENITSVVDVATETTKGRIEIATNAETVAGTDTERATTPSGVKSAIKEGVMLLSDSEINFSVTTTKVEVFNLSRTGICLTSATVMICAAFHTSGGVYVNLTARKEAGSDDFVVVGVEISGNSGEGTNSATFSNIEIFVERFTDDKIKISAQMTTGSVTLSMWANSQTV